MRTRRRQISKFRNIPTPAEWLTMALERKGMSQAQLSRFLARDAGQVNRWLKGREPIPLNHLIDVATHLGRSEEISYAINLKGCEDLASDLVRECETLAKLLLVPAPLITTLLFSLVDDATQGILELGPIAYLNIAMPYVADAIFATRGIHQAFELGRPLVSDETIARHLRYPVNIFIGALLDLDSRIRMPMATHTRIVDFREQSLENLRKTAELTRPKGTLDDLSRQHAVHMLARHGELSDQEYAEALTSSLDIPLRRMAYYGLLMAKRDEDVIAQLQHDLIHNQELARITLAFDAIHYGDAILDVHGRIDDAPARLDRSIANILRHLEQDDHPGMRALCLLKLKVILDTRGTKPFTSPHISARLSAVASRLRSESLSPAEHQLVTSLKEVFLTGNHLIESSSG